MNLKKELEKMNISDLRSICRELGLSYPKGKKSIIKKLLLPLNRQYKMENPNPPFVPVLPLLVEDDKLTELQQLLESGDIDVNNINDDSGETLLMYASRKGLTEMVELLLKYGADLNYKNTETGLTAQKYAEIHGHTKIDNILRLEIFLSRLELSDEKSDLVKNLNDIKRLIRKGYNLPTYYYVSNASNNNKSLLLQKFLRSVNFSTHEVIRHLFKQDRDKVKEDTDNFKNHRDSVISKNDKDCIDNNVCWTWEETFLPALTGEIIKRINGLNISSIDSLQFYWETATVNDWIGVVSPKSRRLRVNGTIITTESVETTYYKIIHKSRDDGVEQIITVITKYGSLLTIDIAMKAFTNRDGKAIETYKKIFKVPNHAVNYVIPTIHFANDQDKMMEWYEMYGDTFIDE